MAEAELKSKTWVFDSVELTLDFSEPVNEKQAVAAFFEKFEAIGFACKVSGKPHEPTLSESEREEMLSIIDAP
jgi:hypothetical protein